MTLQTSATAYAQALLDDTGLTETPVQRLSALAAICVNLVPQNAQTQPPPSETLAWQKLTFANELGGLSSTITAIRGHCIRKGRLYLTTRGSAYPDAQCWYLENGATILHKHSHFNRYAMNTLLADPSNDDMYMGLGSQGVMGEAYVGKYDANENYSQFGPAVADAEMIYDSTWHAGQPHFSTAAENTPGGGKIVTKTAGASTWDYVFARGVAGLPTDYTYATAYLTFEKDGLLYGGMFSRTAGDADLLRRVSGTWVNLGCPIPTAKYVLSHIEHGGSLVLAYGADGSTGPIRAYNEVTGGFDIVGNIPAAWSGATIFNHLSHDRLGRLMVTVGGIAGKLGVWRLDDAAQTWSQIAGNGLNGSWQSPAGTGGAQEWGYRLPLAPDGRSIAGLASEVANGSFGAWALTIS